MAKEKIVTPDVIIKSFKDEFKTKIIDAQIKKKPAGSKKKEAIDIWMKVDKSAFKSVIKHLCDLQYPHLAVASGNDLGKNIELIYHFTLNFDKRLEEINLNISVELPKSKPEIETICDLIPGAQITEREKQEFLGVKVTGIPDNRRLFLPELVPEPVVCVECNATSINTKTVLDYSILSKDRARFGTEIFEEFFKHFSQRFINVTECLQMVLRSQRLSLRPDGSPPISLLCEALPVFYTQPTPAQYHLIAVCHFPLDNKARKAVAALLQIYHHWYLEPPLSEQYHFFRLSELPFLH